MATAPLDRVLRLLREPPADLVKIVGDAGCMAICQSSPCLENKACRLSAEFATDPSITAGFIALADYLEQRSPGPGEAP